MSRLPPKFRWIWIGLSVIVPLVLYRVLAERASWRPRTIYQVRNMDPIGPPTFSPDGQTLAFFQGTLRSQDIVLLDLHTTAWHTLKRRTHAERDGEVVVFAPDGRVLASASREGEVRLWDVPVGQLQRTLPRRTYSSVCSVAFAPDGNTLAAGYDNGTVQLWDPRTGLLGLTKWAGHRANTYAWPPHEIVAFSPDSQTLATSGEHDGSVKLWQMPSGRIKKVLWGQSGAVGTLAFSPDGTLLAGGDAANQIIHVWTLPSGQIHHVLGEVHGFVANLGFSPDGKLMAASDGGRVRIWEARTGRLLRTLNAHDASLAFSPDGKTLATTVADSPSSAGTFTAAPYHCKIMLWRLK